MRKSTIDRFHAKILVENDCWLWTAATHKLGYGQFWDPRKKVMVQAHCWSYEYYVGPIPDDQELDHLCRHRNCVRPEHLELVSHKENVMRGIGPTAINAQKTHCIHGHALAGDNLYVNPVSGARHCYECVRIARGFKMRRIKQCVS